MKGRNAKTCDVLRRLEVARRKPSHVAVDAAVWRSFTGPDGDASAEARSIRCPTLVVWGRHDPVLPSKIDGARARALIGGARYAELDTGHVPFVEDPTGFLEVVMPFLDALPVDASPVRAAP